MKQTAIVVALALSTSACFTQIDSGNVGIESTLGNVKPEILPQGVYQTFTKTIEEYSLKDVPYSFADLTPKTKNNITMKDVDVDVYVKTLPTKLPALYTKYRGDRFKDGNGDYVAANGRVAKAAREAVYSAVSQFEAASIHAARTDLAEKIRKILQEELDSSDKDAFIVTTVNIRSLLTDPALEAAIREQANVDQQISAKQKQIELAISEAKRLKEEAKGQAEANRIIAESITPQLIQLRQTEAALVAAVKTQSVTQINGNATPLVQVK